ncbi:hypothetical protein YB2330_002920 [Saitoella coloradoensis]
MTLRKSLALIPLLLGSLAPSVTADSPSARYSQSLIQNSTTAYIIGGTTSSSTPSSELWSLDFSSSFTSSNASWTKLSAMDEGLTGASAALGGDGRIWVVGGTGTTGNCSSSAATTEAKSSTGLVRAYDAAAGTWEVVSVDDTNVSAPSRIRAGKAFASNDTIFQFGGESCSTKGATLYHNTLSALSTTNTSWTKPANKNAPVAEIDFALTNISSSEVIIMGGKTANENSWVDLGQVAVYDFEGEVWSFNTVVSESGTKPDPRSGASAVTASDGTVFFYGGVVGNETAAASPQLVVLNTTQDTFVYQNVTVGGSAPPEGLAYHSAIITHDDVMLILFGTFPNGTLNSQIYMFDAKTMSWIDSYKPSSSRLKQETITSLDSVTKSSATSSATKAAAASVSVLAVLAAAGAGVIMVIRRRRRRELYRKSVLAQNKPYFFGQPPAPPKRSRTARILRNLLARNGSMDHLPNTWSPKPPSLNMEQTGTGVAGTTATGGLFLPAWAQFYASAGTRQSGQSHKSAVTTRTAAMSSTATLTAANLPRSTTDCRRSAPSRLGDDDDEEDDLNLPTSPVRGSASGAAGREADAGIDSDDDDLEAGMRGRVAQFVSFTAPMGKLRVVNANEGDLSPQNSPVLGRMRSTLERGRSLLGPGRGRSMRRSDTRGTEGTDSTDSTESSRMTGDGGLIV